MQVSGHVKRLGIQQDMVIAHVNHVRNKPCIEYYGEKKNPPFVPQEENKRGKKYCRCQFVYYAEKGQFEPPLAESEMVKKQGLGKDHEAKQPEENPRSAGGFHATRAIHIHPAIIRSTPTQ